LDVDFFFFPVCFGEKSKDAGIRTLVMLDEQGGELLHIV
jgi:hypothetical protein